ncbi:hypothetical protein ACHQM5_029349 [Ranunculus cassubicifolius]
MEDGKMSGKTRCVWITLSVGIFFVILGAILYFTVLKPKEPYITAYPVTLENIDFSVFPSLKLNIALGLMVTVKNRNYGSFRYKDTTSYISYRGGVVAQAPIIGAKIPAHGDYSISTSVQIYADKLVINPYFWSDLNSGDFKFSSLTVFKGKVNVFNIFKVHATARSMCEISVFVKTQTVYSTCNSNLKT